MSTVANLRVDDSLVTVAMSAAEKVEALHGDVTIPRTAVVGTRAVPDGMAEVHGLRTGTGLPGDDSRRHCPGRGRGYLAVCHGRRPTVILDLASQPYDRIVVTVDDPDAVARSLS